MTLTFGCRVNRAETQALERELTRAGLIFDDTSPDVVIINSCAVTGKAEREVVQSIHRIRRRHPESRIVVTGCAATRWAAQGGSPAPETDDLVPNARKSELADALTTPAGSPSPTMSHGDTFLESGRLMVKIQDGCNRFCSYCIVPFLRGRAVSRPTTDIVADIAGYGDAVREAVLTAINTQAFGADTGERLTDLVDRIISETGVTRVSFGSVHPWSIDGEFLSWYESVRTTGRFVDFFHVPIQSGADRTLAAMNRGYTAGDIGERLAAIRAVCPDALIGTDVIVGFPGETDADFRETVAFLERSPIDRLHVFRFSPRTGTAAETMRKRLGDVPHTEKARRSRELIALGERKYRSFVTGLVGREFDALILARVTDGKREVLLRNQVPAVIANDAALVTGSVERVTVESVTGTTLHAKRYR